MIFPVDERIAITPMDMGPRIGGVVEFAGLNAAADPRKFKRLLSLARRAFPGLSIGRYTEWMGHRPCLPDSLPVIDKAPQGHVYFAFGHGHQGLIAAPQSAHAIAALIGGRAPEIDLQPFRVNRFPGHRIG